MKLKTNVDDPNKYVGQWITCTCVGEHEPKEIKIERVIGSLMKPTRFEVTYDNFQHAVVILDFMAQIHKSKTVTLEMIEEFDNMEYHVLTPDEVKRQSEPVNVDAIVDAAFEGAQDVKAE